MTRPHRVASKLLLLALLVVSCSDPTGPRSQPVRVVNVEFEEIRILETSLREGGVLSVSGGMADPVRFEQHDRVRFTVLTSGGDEEELLLRPRICWMGSVAGLGASAHSHYFCNQFLLGARTRSDLENLAPLVEQLPGRYLEGRLCNGLGECWDPGLRMSTVTILEGNLFAAIRKAERWPRVEAVTIATFATIGGPPEGRGNSFHGETPIEFADGVAGDGRVQIRPGDEVTVLYRQPDGSSLTTTVTVP